MSTTPTAPKKTVVPMAEHRSEEGAAPARPPVAAPGGADLGKRLQDVQELLFGDTRRGFEDRLNQTDDRYLELAEEMAARFDALTDSFQRRIDTLQQEVQTRDRDQTAARRRLVNRLGDAIKDMARDA